MSLRRYYVRRRYDARFEIVEASSPREAACKWASAVDPRMSYDICHERTAPVVIVTTEHGRACGEWIVQGETVPEYRARPAPRNRGDTQ